jgi:enoyl-CoA hydratase/carnithine racemase
MSFRQIRVARATPSYWRVSFNNPPINLIDPDTILDLSDLVTQLETNDEVKVVVFDSLDPDFYLAHYDVLVDKAKTIAMVPGPSGMHPWLDVLVRLSRAPVVSIAELRGRARGAGSEFVLACDMRFASAERAILGQF